MTISKDEILLVFIICMFGTLIYMLYGFAFMNIENEYTIFCDSGNFDIFLDYENVEYPHNNTLKIKDFNIYGIDNIKCKIEGKGNMPIFSFLSVLKIFNNY